MNLVPALTAGLAAVVLDERIELAQVIGGAAVLAGVWWTTRIPARVPTARAPKEPAFQAKVAKIPASISQ